MYGIFCLENEGNDFLESLMNSTIRHVRASRRTGNQLASSVTALVSLLSAVAMASVWWKLVVT